MTDIVIFRYVYSVPRAEFDEALASAQAVSIVRGAIVGGLLLCAAPFIARLFSLQSEWSAFAWLAPVVLIRSFENLAPKVAERDYRYGGQLRTMFASAAFSLTAVLITGLITHSHDAIIASLLAQVIGGVFVSHLVADMPYRLDFRSSHVSRAWKFGYPLMFNGMGLAVSSQADRFLVGATLGMSALGLYSVVLLATIVPITMVFRIVGTLNLAAIYHALSQDRKYQKTLRLASNAASMVAALYAGGVILLTNIVVPLVFGSKFVVSSLAVCLLGLGCFIRIVRSEPFSSVMLNLGRTRTLALSNVVTASSVGYMILLFYFWHSINSFFAGRMLGEVTSLVVSLVLAWRKLGSIRVVVSLSTLSGLALVALACVSVLAGWTGHLLAPSAVALTGYSGDHCSLVLFPSTVNSRGDNLRDPNESPT